MAKTFNATEIEIGYHPDGYRIDKTHSAMNRYVKWHVRDDGGWENPTPVCFGSLPTEGWQKCHSVDWQEDSDSHGRTNTD